eukprot:RCo022103
MLSPNLMHNCPGSGSLFIRLHHPIEAEQTDLAEGSPCGPELCPGSPLSPIWGRSGSRVHPLPAALAGVVVVSTAELLFSEGSAFPLTSPAAKQQQLQHNRVASAVLRGLVGGCAAEQTELRLRPG